MLTYERTHRPDPDNDDIWTTRALSSDGVVFRLTFDSAIGNHHGAATRDGLPIQERILLRPYGHDCDSLGCPHGRFKETASDHDGA